MDNNQVVFVVFVVINLLKCNLAVCLRFVVTMTTLLCRDDWQTVFYPSWCLWKLLKGVKKSAQVFFVLHSFTLCLFQFLFVLYLQAQATRLCQRMNLDHSSFLQPKQMVLSANSAPAHQQATANRYEHTSVWPPWVYVLEMRSNSLPVFHTVIDE